MRCGAVWCAVVSYCVESYNIFICRHVGHINICVGYFTFCVGYITFCVGYITFKFSSSLCLSLSLSLSLSLRLSLSLSLSLCLFLSLSLHLCITFYIFIFFFFAGSFTLLGAVKGEDLVGTKYQHPFYERQSEIVTGGDYITTESGNSTHHKWS